MQYDVPSSNVREEFSISSVILQFLEILSAHFSNINIPFILCIQSLFYNVLCELQLCPVIPPVSYPE